jgi:hypothetical protein
MAPAALCHARQASVSVRPTWSPSALPASRLAVVAATGFSDSNSASMSWIVTSGPGSSSCAGPFPYLAKVWSTATSGPNARPPRLASPSPSWPTGWPAATTQPPCRPSACESPIAETGQEDDHVKRHRHTPEQVVRKLREGGRLLNEGKDLLQPPPTEGHGRSTDPQVTRLSAVTRGCMASKNGSQNHCRAPATHPRS